jgi:hypothetical protein
MNDLRTTDEAFFADLRALIHAWCDRHCLFVLADALPAYVTFNGLTDGWGDLYLALRNITTMHRHLLPPAELDLADDLARAASERVSRGAGRARTPSNRS